ncbi:PREDICTED: transmembrane protein 70 homolog, mitochondrial-like [Priapulus caudatus]|uniref:Transmembrane protein 70 homolog, mitochondrial-like n=1 Tax=Priapulus caudatus TaxID=37621 RepID=A0ABM1F1B8_PRICU|nr:PREDICTED: transmembrane protein 70 homolog, mitochondrial-like [Priapulus caudatus]
MATTTRLLSMCYRGGPGRFHQRYGKLSSPLSIVSNADVGGQAQYLVYTRWQSGQSAAQPSPDTKLHRKEAETPDRDVERPDRDVERPGGDGDEAGGRVVYEGVISPIVRRVKILSLTTSAAALALQPALLPSVLSSGGGAAATAAYATFCVGFVFASPLLIHALARRYVTRLRYDAARRTFRATTFSVFARERDTSFSADAARFPAAAGLFTTFLVDGRPFFVDSRMFRDDAAYAALMGYDKPLDISFDCEDNDEREEGEKGESEREEESEKKRGGGGGGAGKKET